MNSQIKSLETALNESAVEDIARKIADDITRQINSIQFEPEIKELVKYPYQLTLETVIQILQTRV